MDSAVDADVMTAAVVEVEDMAETAATMVVTGVTTEGMTAETGAVIEGTTEVTETEIEVVIAALIVVIAQETDMSVADPDPTLVDVARYFL